MSGRIGELLLILVIIFVIFGAGKLPAVMAQFGKGIKALKSNLKDIEDADEPKAKKQRAKAKKD